jgi:hypothetical protein
LEILKIYESIKFEAFFYIVGNCEDVSFSFLNSFSQKNNQSAKEYSFLKIVFAKWRKLTPKKITGLGTIVVILLYLQGEEILLHTRASLV